jgi:hypothetical protein
MRDARNLIRYLLPALRLPFIRGLNANKWLVAKTFGLREKSRN